MAVHPNSLANLAKSKGRPPGARDKLAVEAEEMLDEAWKKLGGADYIVRCGQNEKHVPAVLALFGKRIRARVDVDIPAGGTLAQLVEAALGIAAPAQPQSDTPAVPSDGDAP